VIRTRISPVLMVCCPITLATLEASVRPLRQGEKSTKGGAYIVISDNLSAFFNDVSAT